MKSADDKAARFAEAATDAPASPPACAICLDGGYVSHWESDPKFGYRIDEPCSCPVGELRERRIVRRGRLPGGLSEAELLWAYGGSEAAGHEHAPEGE